MVLGIILYETADILYNVTKLTIKSVAYIYDWYTTEEDEEFVNLDEKGQEIDFVSSKNDNDNIHELIYIKKIEELERKINELNKKIDKTKKDVQIHDKNNDNEENINIHVSVKDNIKSLEKMD